MRQDVEVLPPGRSARGDQVPRCRPMLSSDPDRCARLAAWPMKSSTGVQSPRYTLLNETPSCWQGLSAGGGVFFAVLSFPAALPAHGRSGFRRATSPPLALVRLGHARQRRGDRHQFRRRLGRAACGLPGERFLHLVVGDHLRVSGRRGLLERASFHGDFRLLRGGNRSGRRFGRARTQLHRTAGRGRSARSDPGILHRRHRNGFVAVAPRLTPLLSMETPARRRPWRIRRALPPPRRGPHPCARPYAPALPPSNPPFR
jgi:hypothetical protein